MSDGSIVSNEVSGRRGFLTKLIGFLAGTTLFGGAVKAVARAANDQASSAGGNPKQVDFANPALGQIIMLACSFPPKGWAFCDGSLLPINTNTALFSLLGTTYGGNGSTNFALPDLRGRVPIGFGQGSGLNNYALGQSGGEEAHPLSVNEMPSHNHSAAADNGNGTSATPVGNLPAINNEGIQHYGSTNNGSLNAAAIGNSGGGQSHNNMQPYLAINYVIALQGIFPSQN